MGEMGGDFFVGVFILVLFRYRVIFGLVGFGFGL